VVREMVAAAQAELGSGLELTQKPRQFKT